LDREPISLDFTVHEPTLSNQLIQISSYFKADPVILTKPENVKLQKQAWLQESNAQDKYTKFKLAKTRMRATYKQLYAPLKMCILYR
jgi:hypothetical protein